MSEERKNPIDLTFQRVFCAWHGEPFRPQWPKGSLLFSMGGFQFLIADPEKLLGLRSEPGQAIAVAAIEAALDQKPMCCRLPPEEVLRLYRDSGIGTVKACAVCNGVKMGTPISTRQRKYGHVCFDCHLRRGVLLN